MAAKSQSGKPDSDQPQSSKPAGKKTVARKSLLELLDRQRHAHREQVPSYRQRMGDLRALDQAVYQNRHALAEVLSEDFGNRAVAETMLAEVMGVLTEIRHTRRKLRRWMRPQRVATGWRYLPGQSQIMRQPLGCVGIVAAWNYPIYLSLSPLVSALAAGNHVLIKPSELAPKTALFLQQMLAQLFPEERVAAVVGDASVAADFSALPFDHLLFTGGAERGKQVLKAAADNLTPVTLELGGKSPAIVLEDSYLPATCKRLAYGKLVNAGQTCIAPDYALVDEDIELAFLDGLKAAIKQQYPEFAGNADYTHIINQHHYQRLQSLLEDAEARGATLMRLGEDATRGHDYVMAPVLVTNVSEDMLLMQQEIFGPILPVKTYRQLDDAIRYVNDRPKPLALYVFSKNPKLVNQLLQQTVSGTAAVNECLYQIAQPNLPFGGVGDSGMGHYHGEHGFLTFSKEKSVFIQARFTALDWAKPPYGRWMAIVLRMLIRKR